jgi:hypothetical protein
VEIQIQKEASKCLSCGQPFTHEQKHFSLLKFQDNVFAREDYCEECWPKLSSDGTNPIYSTWQTKYRDPAAARETPEGQFMPLLSLFYENLAGGASAEAVCYVCALVLRRQKVFKFVREEKESTSNRPVLVFHDRHHDVQVKVVDPNVSEAEFREVKRKLEEHLSPKENADE